MGILSILTLVINICGQAASNLGDYLTESAMVSNFINSRLYFSSIVFGNNSSKVSGILFSKQQRLLLETLWGYGYMSSIKEIILALIGINLCNNCSSIYYKKHNAVVWYFMIIACTSRDYCYKVRSMII